MSNGYPLKAVLFDIGGTLTDERKMYDRALQAIRDVVSKVLDRELELWEVERARVVAIDAFTPSFTKGIIWQILKPDEELTNLVCGKVRARIYDYDEDLPLASSAGDLIPSLHPDFKLALAGNELAYIKDKLALTGLMEFFEPTWDLDDSKLPKWLRDHTGLRKPDTRFFLRICELIKVDPCECCMIGNRLCNDIYPAKMLGMRTIWIQSGPHGVQEPRVPEDVADADITHLGEVLDLVNDWATQTKGTAR